MKTNHNQPPISLENPSILPENIHNLLNRKDLVATIRGDNLIIFKGKDSAYHAKKRDPLADDNLKKRKYTGTLSKSSVKFISDKINTWAKSITTYEKKKDFRVSRKQYKLVFATLTLPAKQVHSDKEIKRKILVPFIDKLKYHYNIHNYFWRAEAQESGNIHFHMILDCFIEKKELQKLWNQTTDILGYLSTFKKKHGHAKPPSTHIRAINNPAKTIKYVLKYATKNDERRPITGRIWGMNDNLRCIRRYFYLDVEEIREPLINLLSEKGTFYKEDEHYISIKIPRHIRRIKGLSGFYQDYENWLLRVFHILYYDRMKFDEDPGHLIAESLDFNEINEVTKKYL